MKKDDLKELMSLKEHRGWAIYHEDLKKTMEVYKEQIVTEISGHDPLFSQTDLSKMKFVTLKGELDRLDNLIEDAKIDDRNEEYKDLDPYEKATKQAKDIKAGKL